MQDMRREIGAASGGPVLSVALGGLGALPHELKILAGAELPFLPPLTPQAADDGARLLYAVEGLVPLAQAGARTGVALNDFFVWLGAYIRCLLAARDRLLNPAHIGSDPARSVFVDLSDGSLRVLYAADGAARPEEKICRVAAFFAAQKNVLGAETAMARFAARLRAAPTGLRATLKLAESVQREWNYI